MTTSYATGNAIGSTDVRDLSDNASNWDEGLNSPSPSFTDRFGKRRLTWTGFESGVNDFFLNAGYQDKGAYSAGVVLSARNQIVQYQGNFYAAAATTTVPYTLNGTWSTDSPNLILIPGGSGSLSTSLAAITGATLVGYGPVGVSGTVNRTVASRLGEQVSLRDFGAAVDGTTSVTTALTAANAANLAGLTVPAGSYLVSANTTLNMPVTMLPGSKFVIPDGVTLTLSNTFDAPLGQRFACTGTGKVVFNEGKISVGYPEWWGATTKLMTDATAAMQACNIALPLSQYQASDYYVATTFQMNTPGHGIKGRGCNWFNKVSDSTRIISMSGSAHVINVGPTTQPATINDFPQGIYIEDLQVTRSVAPVIASQCAGVLSRWTLFQSIKYVKSAESMHGFQYIGAVQVETIRSQAFRSIGGTGAGTDYSRGFHIDGSTVLAGVAGGNASVHWERCVAGCVLAMITSYGMFINGAWADTFVTRFESSGCTVGVYCGGDTTAALNYRTVDLHLDGTIVDQHGFAAIFVDGTSPFANIKINGGYGAPSSSGTPTANIFVQSSQGAVTISDFQHILGPNSVCPGLFVFGSNNVISRDNTYQDCAINAVVLIGSNNCRISDQVVNNGKTGQAGVQMTNSSRNKVDIMLSGKAGYVALGVQLVGAANNYNEINATGIDTSAISTAKVQINGTTVTATGTVGTNLVTGILA